jgi:hypothetical protein
MLGVPRELIEHSLNVHAQAIKREIAKLLAAVFIKEVIDPEWVANQVLVKKKNNEWRM